MFRWLRALASLVRGWFGSKADNLHDNPLVMAQSFDNAISSKTATFDQVKTAVGMLVGLKAQKVAKVKSLGERIDTLSRVKAGAGAKLKARATLLVEKCKADGITDKDTVTARLNTDPEYLKHQGAYNDSSSSLAEAQGEFEREEKDLIEYDKRIATHKTQLQTMQRNIKKLQEEKHDAIADTQLAKEMDAVSTALGGITTSGEDKDLEAARKARQRAVGRAAISSELSGTDAAAADAEYAAYATAVESNKELDDLLDLDSMLGGAKEKLEPSKLAE